MNPLALVAVVLVGLGGSGGGIQVDRAAEAFGLGEYEAARDAWAAQLAQNPAGTGGWMVLYNLACAESMLGNSEAAAEYLLDSIGHGFVDFYAMERDAHLDNVRGNENYGVVLQNWRKLLDARGEAEIVGLSGLLGEGYTFDREESLRVHYVSALGATGIETARQEVRRVQAWAEAHVFGLPQEDESKPHAWVSVIVPTARDFYRFIRSSGVGGVYDKDQKRLVTRDIGASLRHEYFHVVHWRDMAERGQAHPFWVMEGLASVVEDVRDDGVGGVVPVESWRTNIVKRLERRGLLTKWPVLFRLERDRFVGSRGRAYYAQSRAVCMYFADQGLLKDWYSAYVADFDRDPSGLGAVETAFGKPVREVERAFRVWVRGLEEVAEQSKPGSAGLGVSVASGVGDGVVVDQIVSGSRGGAEWLGRERLRKGDVILSVDGEATATLDEYYRVVGGHEIGDPVMIRIRRGEKKLIDVQARLVEEQEDVGW